MKKSISFWGGVILLLALIGCGRDPEPAAVNTTPAPATATPVAVTLVPDWTAAPTDVSFLEEAAQALGTEAEAEGERIVGLCVSVTDELPFTADLDGDGTRETVDLVRYAGADEYPRWAVVLTGNGGEKRFETDIPCDTFYDLWVGDLDEDGAYEIFFHGDLASDDYLIYGFRSDLAPLFFQSDPRAARWGGDGESNVFDGYIEGFEDGHLIIRGTVDMLGTHWGVRTFALGDDGVIGPVSTVWTFDDEIEAERPLTVKKALTAHRAKARKDPGEAFTLKEGERIYLLCSDGWQRMWFETESGQGGVLELTADEETMWLIDGEPEADFFDELPYAG